VVRLEIQAQVVQREIQDCPEIQVQADRLEIQDLVARLAIRDFLEIQAQVVLSETPAQVVRLAIRDFLEIQGQAGQRGIQDQLAQRPGIILISAKILGMWTGLLVMMLMMV
jgi:hypothetical protein